MSRLPLPVVIIQPTFRTVISEVDSGVIPFESFWVSCYRQKQPSVHAKIHVELDAIHRDVVNLVTTEGDVQIDRQVAGTSEKYTIACPTLDIPHTRIILPEQVYADPDRCDPLKPQRITAFDISPDGTQFSTGFRDGSVHTYPVSSEPDRSIVAQKISKSHLSSVTSLQYFPSSRVLLTASADFSLTILPAEPSPLPEMPDSTVTTTTRSAARVSPVRTLRGHRKAITSTAIVSRGRNVLSGSSDGTVRLWDVSSGQQIRSMSPGNGKYTPVSCMSLGERRDFVDIKMNGNTTTSGDSDSPPISGETTAADEREVDTADKIVFCGLLDGSFEAFDVGAGRSVAKCTPPSAEQPVELISIAYASTHNMLATGSIDGTVSIFDTRSLSAPLLSFYRTAAGVDDVRFFDNLESFRTSRGLGGDSGGVGLLVGSEDGQAFVADVRPEGPAVLLELEGVDCDSVRAVRVGGSGDIWTAADDGIVRRY